MPKRQDDLDTSWKTWDRAVSWVHTDRMGKGKALGSLLCVWASTQKYSMWQQLEKLFCLLPKNPSNPSKSIKIHYRGTYFQTFPKRVHAPRVPWEDSHNLMYIVLYGCHSICVNSLGGSGRINSSEDIFTPLGQKREGAWVRVQRVSLAQDMKTWIFTYTDIRAKYRGLLYTFKIC